MNQAKVPIETIHLYEVVDRMLFDLLNSLSPSDWSKPTRAKKWTVKDVASHMLDINLRIVSTSRDAYFGDPPGSIESYQDLVAYLNRLNADWVQAAKRLSPRVLIELLATSAAAYREHVAALNPFDEALFSVAWAGQQRSQNWFNIARDYTEKWHHQMQIREAVGKVSTFMDPGLYHPVLATFMHALPYHYRSVSQSVGATLKVSVTGEAGGIWFLTKSVSGWELATTAEGKPSAEISISEPDAWKLFTNGLSEIEARKVLTFHGDPVLCEPMLTVLGIMA